MSLLSLLRGEFLSWSLGNNGSAGSNLVLSQFQNSQSPSPAPCATGTGRVSPYLAKTRNSSYITIIFTLPAVAMSSVWLGVEDSSAWQIGVILYVEGLITYLGALTFWTTAFPGLPRHLRKVQCFAREIQLGNKTLQDNSKSEFLSRNHVSNASFIVSSIGEISTLPIMLGILGVMKAEDNSANNKKASSALIAFSGGVWCALLCTMPWFLLENRCPGLALAPRTSLLTDWISTKCFRLEQTFLGDVLNTTVVVSYSTLRLTLLLIVGVAAQALDIYGHRLVRKGYKISTNKVLAYIHVLTVWSLISVHADKFGFKNVLYQAFYGLMVRPWHAYGQTMFSGVSPLPQITYSSYIQVGKTSAFFGPRVSSVVISASGSNNNMSRTISALSLYSVATEKSRVQRDQFVAAETNREAFNFSKIQ
ncbi:MFS general substrate transporter [Pisolithus thermaeus]|nr:MFS general substrate transporter [Pisolithus thermaeus]